MENSSPSIKFILFTSLFSFIIIGFLFFKFSIDRRTKIVFCDVGQGDATYIRIHNKIDILVDAGPDNSVLRCLSEHMPFYDRTIEMAFMSHPQQDHYFGFLEIGRRYKILNMFMNPIKSKNKSFEILMKILTLNDTHIYFPNEGINIQADKDSIELLWPTKTFLTNNLTSYQDTRTNEGLKLQSADELKEYMGETTLDPNVFSLIFTLRENNLTVLFTGDADAQTLSKIENKSKLKTAILKVPHHGSKSGLNLDFLQLADPTISVISAGRNNRYNHPSKEVLQMLDALHKLYFGTYSEGDLVFYIQGQLIERAK